jgi:hypothetical protein
MEVVVVTLTATNNIYTTTITTTVTITKTITILNTFFFFNIFYGQSEVQDNVIFCLSKFITQCFSTPNGCCLVLAPVPTHCMFRYDNGILR